MSRRGKKDSLRASPTHDSDEFVMVTPRAGSGEQAAADASSSKPEPLPHDAPHAGPDPFVNRVKGTPEEEAAYDHARELAYRADLLGVDVPPVAPPGHVLVQETEPTKVTFWTLLFRRAENRSALQQLYFTTVLMVTLPLGLMAFAYYVLLSSFEDEPRLMWSGFAGVLGVNIVAIGFGLFAYYDSSGDDEEDEPTPAGDSAEAMEEKRKRWAAWEAEKEAEESLEDRERLEALRLKREELAGGAKAESSTDSSSSSQPALKSRQPRSRSAKKDSALSDAPADDEAEPASGSRNSRARAKKA